MFYEANTSLCGHNAQNSHVDICNRINPTVRNTCQVVFNVITTHSFSLGCISETKVSTECLLHEGHIIVFIYQY